jgi:hypothetical protein
VPHRTILDLLPELRSSADVLRCAFASAPGKEPATTAVSQYGGGRVDELVRLLDESGAPDGDRDALAQRAHSLADELEASADLLALLERASAPVATEVNVGLIVRETARMSGSASGRQIKIRFQEPEPRCVVTTDPYVVGSLLLLAVSGVMSSGADSVAVRVGSSPGELVLTVEAAGAGDMQLPPLAMHVLPAVPPTEQAAARVAAQIGGRLDVDRTGPRARWSIVVGSASG